MNIKKIVMIGINVSLSVVLSILESLIPFGYFGVKIGLANIITMVVLYMFSYKEALLVLFLRVILVGLLYSGITSISFLMSLSGAIVSVIGMLLIYKIDKNKIFLLSITGSIFHLIGQFIVLLFYIKLDGWAFYIPILLVLSVITGIITALITNLVLKAFKIDVKSNRLIEIIVSISLVISFVVSEIIIISNNTKSYSEIGRISLDSKVVLEIDLNNPSNYKAYDSCFIEQYKENDSYFYKLNIHNYDDSDSHEAIIEVNNKRIKVHSISCKNGDCIRMGWINKNYQKIVCLPNKLVISIVSYSDSQIDYIL